MSGHDEHAAERIAAYFQPDGFPGYTLDEGRAWTSQQVKTQQRARNPEPVAGQPRPRQPRDVRPHWIDRLNTIIGIAMIAGIFILGATR